MASNVIVVTSGKGGVGKTTTSANVGTGLAKLGKKVCLIDTDIGLRNLDVVMGLENRIVYNLVDVVETEKPEPAPIFEAVSADEVALAVAELAEQQVNDKLEVDLALAELAEMITGGE